jgi:adenosylhomocysteine nucleosidase
MSELAFDDPCIVFALRREAEPFLREFHPNQRFAGAPCWARFCGPAWLTVLSVQAGVGPRHAERALDWLLGRPLMGNVPYRPKIVLSAGFSGALCAERKVGDVILATEVADTEGHRWPATWPGELPAGEWRPTLHRGAIACAATLASAEQKQDLGQQLGALAVDMESAVVARACTKHGVPFGCLRVVSDEMTTPLSPQLLALLSEGRVSALRLLAALARSPSLAGQLWRLARHTRFAAEQLAKALGELLTLTLDWGRNL